MKLRFLASSAVVAVMVAVTSLSCGRASHPGPRLFFTAGNSLYSVADDGTGLNLVTGVSTDTPPPVVFSPDGERVAHPCRPDGATDQSQTALCLARVDGSDQHMITEDRLDPPGFLSVAGYGGASIAWSADSRRVAFLVFRTAAADVVSSGDIYVYDIGAQTMSRVDTGAFAELRSPLRWSPDNRHIAVPTVERLGASGVIRLIDIGEGQAAATMRDIGPGQALEDYQWAPDGSALAYAGSATVGVSNVYVVSPDGGTPRMVMEQQYPTKLRWSPDARSLAVSVISGGVVQVYVVPPAGGDPSALTPGFYRSETPEWSRDVRTVAFVGTEAPGPPDRFPDTALYAVPAGGGTPKKLTGDQQMVIFPLVTWTPDGKRVFYTAAGPPCMEGCPPGPLFAVLADGSGSPVAITTSDVLVGELLGWH